MTNTRADRLYELLPVVYRMRDAEQGEPLKALLKVIAEQANLVEDDIAQLYENWFIETCEDWVVPYLGDLVGYEPVHEAGEPASLQTAQGQQRNNVLIPRREVANTLRYRRRKGALALLELLSQDSAGWPARAVEFYALLGWTQALNHLQLERGRTVDIRKGAALDGLGSPFDSFAHNVDVRRINSRHTHGRHNIASVAVFVWRLKVYGVTGTPAYRHESSGQHCFTFSALGNDSPLYTRAQAESDPTHIAEEINLPVPIRRRWLQADVTGDASAGSLPRLYGAGNSLQIWTGKKRGNDIIRQPVPGEQIVAADLTDWRYAPRRGKVAVDPRLGRIAFPVRHFPKHGVWVSYHYGFSMDLGGGEYERPLIQPGAAGIYTVGKGATYPTINAALQAWDEQRPEHAVIEITDSGVYVEPICIEFKTGHTSLQLRAANRQRPLIRLLDWQVDQPDALAVTGEAGSYFTLDGLLISGRGVQAAGDLSELTLRHTTLVPGWTLDEDCEPVHGTEPSLEIFSPAVCVRIEHSILGSIQINPLIPEPEEDAEQTPDELDDQAATDDERALARCQGQVPGGRLDPIRICISDSIVDASDPQREAIGEPGCAVAHACLNIVRSTVFGQLQVHAMELGENCIFEGRVTVARRQQGCLRFSYVTPGSRTPRRYRCQPDLVEQTVQEKDPGLDTATLQAKQLIERLRVRPQFNSVRYGTPAYCQLSGCCAQEIKAGADDESEMGVFHNLYQPQRMANLTVRLDEYLPARMDVGIIVSS
ncbi:hypothetical protein [Marinobacter sp. X15-166B]|uniref:hypothetical protein n=1 Tax=Marinobacter sp. X15-166B TaxID=1897620 RepID=UPI00085C06E1|nr:hypothetical protein [Marinobacter sp. X15-166B]OEY66764.1 hypothetical protein BG841_10065 [Marinobacter sp. X15-166B]